MRTLPLCTCRRHYPGAAAGCPFRSLPQPFQPSPHGCPGRPAHRPFRGLLSVHSRYGLHTRQVTRGDPLLRGFSHFVTSMTAPMATGWSESCRVGLAPTEKRRLCTAHAMTGRSWHAPRTTAPPDSGHCVQGTRRRASTRPGVARNPAGPRKFSHVRSRQRGCGLPHTPSGHSWQHDL